MIKVSVIGSGNVAQHLIKEFLKKDNLSLVQVYARNISSLQNSIPKELITNDFSELKEADLYIISVTDSAIEEVSNSLPFQNRLVVHTSGSMDLTVLNSKNRKGVFYPLQTFSKSKEIDFKKVPLCLESNNTEDYLLLEKVATAISDNIYQIDSEQRKAIHVSAVFVCNFVNHLYQIGHTICQENKIPFEILKPLINETASKINQLTPSEAQTGPAIRKDQKTIDSHINFLKDPNLKNLYQFLTQSIQKNV